MVAFYPQICRTPIRRVQMSKEMREGRVVYRDVLERVYDDINRRFGSKEKVPE